MDAVLATSVGKSEYISKTMTAVILRDGLKCSV